MARPDPHHWTQLRRRRVKADELGYELGYEWPPIPVNELAARMGIRLLRTNEQYSGLTHFNSQTGAATVWYNYHEPLVRQRFTIAHEIGHIMLHPEGVFYRDTAFSDDKRQEAQANRFAASLLMPDWLIDDYGPDYGFDIDKLARVFNVSKAAMTYRINTLFGD